MESGGSITNQQIADADPVEGMKVLDELVRICKGQTLDFPEWRDESNRYCMEVWLNETLVATHSQHGDKKNLKTRAAFEALKGASTSESPLLPLRARAMDVLRAWPTLRRVGFGGPPPPVGFGHCERFQPAPKAPEDYFLHVLPLDQVRQWVGESRPAFKSASVGL